MKKVKIGRLAFRSEGRMWSAYYAKEDTMEGATLIGSISLKLVQNKDRKSAFIAVMKDVVADILEEVTGIRPTFPNQPTAAPGHEALVRHVDESLAKQLEKSIARNSRLKSALMDVRKELQYEYDQFGRCSIPIGIIDEVIKEN
jgi:hypothetical protein